MTLFSNKTIIKQPKLSNTLVSFLSGGLYICYICYIYVTYICYICYIYIYIYMCVTRIFFDYLCYYIPTHGTHIYSLLCIIYIYIYFTASTPLSGVFENFGRFIGLKCHSYALYVYKLHTLYFSSEFKNTSLCLYINISNSSHTL